MISQNNLRGNFFGFVPKIEAIENTTVSLRESGISILFGD